jgi:hypothetical protein
MQTEKPADYIATESGTKEQRPGTGYCDTCKRFVRTNECGTTPAHVEDFAAAMAAWPCRFPDGGPALIAELDKKEADGG